MAFCMIGKTVLEPPMRTTGAAAGNWAWELADVPTSKREAARKKRFIVVLITSKSWLP